MDVIRNHIFGIFEDLLWGVIRFAKVGGFNNICFLKHGFTLTLSLIGFSVTPNVNARFSWMYKSQGAKLKDYLSINYLITETENTKPRLC